MARTKVKDVYENVAKHFDETRGALWPGVLRFLSRFVSNHNRVIDLGCGNGKYIFCPLSKQKQLKWTGIDICHSLIDICHSKNTDGMVKFICADVCNGIFLTIHKDDKVANVLFHHAMSIAVLHHIDTVVDRIRFLSQMKNVVVHGGYCLVVVWATSTKPATKWKYTGNSTDWLVPWLDKYSGETYWRFYHLFECDELVGLVKQVGGVVVECWWERDNWYCIFKYE